jgi:hypothetical protein
VIAAYAHSQPFPLSASGDTIESTDALGLLQARLHTNAKNRIQVR